MALLWKSEANPVQKFGEIIIKGRAPRVDCVDILGRPVIALPFFDAVVLGPRQEIETDLLDYELEDCDTVLPLDARTPPATIYSSYGPEVHYACWINNKRLEYTRRFFVLLNSSA